MIGVVHRDFTLAAIVMMKSVAKLASIKYVIAFSHEYSFKPVTFLSCIFRNELQGVGWAFGEWSEHCCLLEIILLWQNYDYRQYYSISTFGTWIHFVCSRLCVIWSAAVKNIFSYTCLTFLTLRKKVETWTRPPETKSTVDLKSIVFKVLPCGSAVKLTLEWTILINEVGVCLTDCVIYSCKNIWLHHSRSIQTSNIALLKQ